MAESKQAQPEKRPAEIMFITSTKKVDKFNKICTRIELTPAVCEICGFDLCAQNDLPPYYDTEDEKGMDAATQARAREAVQKHKELVHTQASQLLIHADEVPTQWLGDAREKKERAKKKILKG